MDFIRSLNLTLSDLIDRVKKLFSDPVKVAIIIRNEQHEDRDVFIGDATPEDVAHILDKLKNMEKHN